MVPPGQIALPAETDPLAAGDARPAETDPSAPGEGRVRSGVARRDLKVLGEPSPSGLPIGEIKAGEMVMLVRESGEWALVVQSGEDGVVMGWTQRREIALP